MLSLKSQIAKQDILQNKEYLREATKNILTEPELDVLIALNINPLKMDGTVKTKTILQSQKCQAKRKLRKKQKEETNAI